VKVESLEKFRELEKEIVNCKKCPLYLTRKNAVPGEGDLRSPIMFIGEAPGRNEDIEGRPFVGAAGRLLDSLLESIGLRREKVYITNIVKCRPPNNRDPRPEEIKACSPYLDRQIAYIKPKLIVTLGRHSTKYLLEKNGFAFRSILKIHGRIYSIKVGKSVIKLIPTLHPAAALYNPKLLKILKEDFNKIKDEIERISRGKEKVGLEKFL